MPSRIILIPLRRIPATARAARIPRKKVTPIAAEAVFKETRIGDRFMKLRFLFDLTVRPSGRTNIRLSLIVV
jgi:hypothetical protein